MAFPAISCLINCFLIPVSFAFWTHPICGIPAQPCPIAPGTEASQALTLSHLPQDRLTDVAYSQLPHQWLLLLSIRDGLGDAPYLHVTLRMPT